MVLGLIFKYLFYFELIFAYGVMKWPNLIFYMYLFSFPNTIY